MEITDMAIMIVREIKSIPSPLPPHLPWRWGEGKRNKPPSPAGRVFAREELWGVIKHFNNAQSSGFSLGLWGF